MNQEQFKSSEIRDKLDKLRSLDHNFNIFGSDSHKYQLNPTISTKKLKEVSESNGFSLPEDYVEFISNIGNGGAGKDFGLHDFEKAIEYGKTDSLFIGVEELMNRAGEKEWNNNRLQLILNHRNQLEDAFLGLDLNKIDTIQLFRKAEQLKLISKTDEKYWIYYQVKTLDEYPFDYSKMYLEAAPNLVNGYIELFTHGCGHISALVVKGKSFGKMISIGHGFVLSETGLSFQEYYLGWLNDSLKKIQKIAEHQSVQIHRTEVHSKKKNWNKMKNYFTS